MQNLINLKGNSYEIISVKDHVIEVNPPFNEPVKISGHVAKINGNACAAEQDILKELGNGYTAIATSPTAVQIYKNSDYDKALADTPLLPGITVNNVWYVNNISNKAVAELTDLSLVMFNIKPFRLLTDQDLTPYKGHHPRKLKGQPLPDYLYRFYGLVKNSEIASEVIHITLTPSEKQKLDTVAKNNNTNISKYIRDYINTL
jgi:hypothetical protein